MVIIFGGMQRIAYGAEESSYFRQTAPILQDITNSIFDVSYAIMDFSDEKISEIELMRTLKRNREDSLHYLKKFIRLTEIATDSDIHARSVKVVSGWNLALDGVIEGIETDDMDMLITSFKFIQIVGNEARKNSEMLLE